MLIEARGELDEMKKNLPEEHKNLRLKIAESKDNAEMFKKMNKEIEEELKKLRAKAQQQRQK